MSCFRANIIFVFVCWSYQLLLKQRQRHCGWLAADKKTDWKTFLLFLSQRPEIALALLHIFHWFPCFGKTGKQILWPPFYCLSACSTMAVWLAPAHLPPSSSSESSVVPAHIWPLTLTRRVAIMLLLLKYVANTNNWLPSIVLLLQNMHGLSWGIVYSWLLSAVYFTSLHQIQTMIYKRWFAKKGNVKVLSNWFVQIHIYMYRGS